jgi:hypothetical protein
MIDRLADVVHRERRADVGLEQAEDDAVEDGAAFLLGAHFDDRPANGAWCLRRRLARAKHERGKTEENPNH